MKKKRIAAVLLALFLAVSFAAVDVCPVQASPASYARYLKKKKTKSISAKKALTLAKNNAKKNYKIKASTIRDVEVEKDMYKGKKTWEVSFEARTKKGKHYYDFEYQIARSGGKILHREKERD